MFHVYGACVNNEGVGPIASVFGAGGVRIRDGVVGERLVFLRIIFLGILIRFIDYYKIMTYVYDTRRARNVVIFTNSTLPYWFSIYSLSL